MQFFRFCLVGGTGVLVDMAVLHLLADPRWLHWNISLSKICSAESAMLNNFIWNELWTFRRIPGVAVTRSGVVRRLVRFHAICGIGMGMAVLFLHLFHTWLGLNLYASNLLAILLVTLWNFGMNAIFNWRASPTANS
ncbi:MAG: GtrA family protein [Verrucomicrobia bacterium]|nr:GtrA family protein [Verrucomicrobiota bacterium]